MNKSRTEHYRRLRSQRKRKNTRLLLVLSAAALLCAAGTVWMWSQSGPGGRDSGGGRTVPAETPVETASPSPAGSPTPTPQPSDDLQPSPEAPPSTAPNIDSSSALQPSGDGSALRMAFVGDVIFADNVEALLKKNGYDYPYRELKDELLKPDITAANLETPVTARGQEQVKEYTYRSRPEALQPFKEAGFDVVNVANNHIMDFGEDGLLDTLKHLDEEGILRTGAGKDLNEAYRPAVMEKNGMKVAFLGFSHKVPDKFWKAGVGKPGTTQLYDPTLALEAVAKAKSEADVVVVMAHWGEERQFKPLQTDRILAHKFIDAGADLIIGSHPHVLQSFERYKGKWIAYSLGNFIFTTNTFEPSWETVILNAACAKDGSCELSAVPVQTTYARPVRMEAGAAGKLFRRLTDISYGVRVDANGNFH